MITLPGLIDPHVHLRTPGQSYKEDFLTGAKAALAGGFTTVLDMPNNITPITTLKLLEEKMTLASGHPELDSGSINISGAFLSDGNVDSRLPAGKTDFRGNDRGSRIYCDLGFHFGSLGNNLEQFETVQSRVFGLKIYLNQTTGGFIVDKEVFKKICQAWPSANGRSKPILVHAEEDVIEDILQIGHQTNQRIHVCHVSSQSELQKIIDAKKKGWSITCGVTPHHLFLTDEDAKKLGPFGRMKPFLKSND